MPIKFLSLFVILIFLVFLFPILPAYASTVEEVYTNAFDARLVAWVEVGASPYLSDSDANYIYTATDGREEGDWTFPNSEGSGTINSVKLRFELRGSVADCGDLLIYVWDGTSWVYAGVIGLSSTTYGWVERDVSTILDSWDKINGAEVYVHYTKYLTGTCYVRRLTRKVDYILVTAEERSYSFTETMHPTATLYQWQEHSHSFSETIVITSILNQWQEHTYVFQQTISPLGAVSYWQEHLYTFTETTSPSTTLLHWIEGVMVFFESFTETLHSSATMMYQQEHSYIFVQTFNSLETLIYELEGTFTFIENILPSVSPHYWQEQLYIFIESTTPISTLHQWIESAYQFFEYTFTEYIFPSATLKLWQEQAYTFIETIHMIDVFAFEILEAIINYIALALGGLGFFLSFIPLADDDEKTKALGAIALILCLSGLAFSILSFDYALPIASIGFILALASMALAATKKD